MRSATRPQTSAVALAPMPQPLAHVLLSHARIALTVRKTWHQNLLLWPACHR